MDHVKLDRTLQCPPTTVRRLRFVLKASLTSFLLMTALSPSHIGLSDAAQGRVNCSIHNGACSQRLAGLNLMLDINPKPVRAMRKLEFRVSFAGAEPERPPYIDLSMPAMNMGPNRVILEKISPAQYAGAGVIVRCPSGDRIWQATVTIPGRGEAAFIFDVVY